MDSSENRRVALLSIHPEYADAILAGRKAVEFRKRPFAHPVDRVVIYSTSPVQRVVGTFEVDSVDVATPDLLWKRYGHIGEIDRRDFKAYYANSKQGAAIRIHSATRLRSPVPLHVLGDVHPPQSFAYLDVGARDLLATLTPAAMGLDRTEGEPRGAGVLSEFIGLLTALPRVLMNRVRHGVSANGRIC